MGYQRGRLSSQGHREVYDYFYNIGRRNLKNFEAYWGDIADFDPKQGFKLSKILYFLAKDLPNHHTGSKNQRRVGKYIKENFHVWENKALIALRAFDSRALSNSIWAMAVFGVNPSQRFMNSWHQKYIGATHAETEFNSQHYANPLWALAVLQSQNPDLDLKPIYDDIRSKVSAEDFAKTSEQKQVYSADIYFTGESSITNPPRKETIGSDEKRLKAIFKRAGYKVYKSSICPIPGLNQAIDFTVENEQGQKIHIESDGKPHFHNPRAKDVRNLKFNLYTRFRAALVNRLAPAETVAHVDFRTLMLLRQKSTNVQTAFAHATFNNAIEAGPGAYHSKLGDRDFIITDMIPKRSDGSLPSFLQASAPIVVRQEGVNGSAALPDPHIRQNSQLNETRPPILTAK